MDPQALIAALQQAFFSGQGLLDARALWASIVGPTRLAMARTQSRTLSARQSVEVYENIGAANTYVYVGVSLPGDSVGTVLALFSRESEVGAASSVPANLIPAMISGNFFSAGFGQLLLPGDQLYAKLPAGAPDQKVIIAAAVF